MRAWIATEDGPRLEERVYPLLRETDVRVRVSAAALNRVDLAMSKGARHGAAGGTGAVLGVEFAGEVLEVGPGVLDFAPGDRVMGSGAGAFAEVAVTDYGRLVPLPSGLDALQAACLPVALQTMHDAIATQGQLEPGQSVLIHGASSGVGLMGLRIARVLGARTVIGSSRSAERRRWLTDYGADLALDPGCDEFESAVLEATEGRGVDLAVDQVAGDSIARIFSATRVGGCVVNVGRLGGARAPFDFDLHALRRLRYVGVTFRTRTRAEVRALNERMLHDLAKPLAARQLELPVHHVFGFEALPEALACMRADQHFGKLVLRVAS